MSHEIDFTWEEFEKVAADREEQIRRAIGITDEVNARLLARGIQIVSIIEDTGAEGEVKHVDFRYIKGTPAYRLWELSSSNPSLSLEERQETALRFYKDAKTDEDDAHFRAQWPELF